MHASSKVKAWFFSMIFLLAGLGTIVGVQFLSPLIADKIAYDSTPVSKMHLTYSVGLIMGALWLMFVDSFKTWRKKKYGEGRTA